MVAKERFIGAGDSSSTTVLDDVTQFDGMARLPPPANSWIAKNSAPHDTVSAQSQSRVAVRYAPNDSGPFNPRSHAFLRADEHPALQPTASRRIPRGRPRSRGFRARFNDRAHDRLIPRVREDIHRSPG